MKTPRPSWFPLVGAAALMMAVLFVNGCIVPRQTHRSSSVVGFLYPGQNSPLPPTSVPVLRLPLRVGIAFVPSGSGGPADFSGASGISEMKKNELLQRAAAEFKGRDYIESIEVIPTAYLRPGGGFANLDQIRGLLNVDVIALVAFDQVQFTNENFLSLAYWTIVGAYIFHGNKNDTQTLMEAAVYDIPSRHLLFRAPGGSQIKATTAAVYLPEKLRQDGLKSFDAATVELTANLKIQLEGFRERVKNAPGEVTIERKPGYTGGGSVDAIFVAGFAAFSLVRLFRRRNR